MDWRDRVPACLGEQDLIFASHPTDEERAKKAIREAKAAGHHAMISRKRWSGTYTRTSQRTGFCKSTPKNRLDGYTKCREAGSGRRDGLAAAWPWVHAGVASRLNYPPERRWQVVLFFGQPM